MLSKRSNLMLLLGSVILAVAVQHTAAIYCWQCNSVQDKFCTDLPKGPVDNSTQLEECYRKFYKKCESDTVELNYTFCRKQVQIINNEKRIIRSCGFERSQTECYYTKNPPVSTHVCECNGDGCNGSSTISLNLMFGIVSLLTLRWIL